MDRIKENLLPFALGGIGLILVVVGVFQYIFQKPDEPALIVEQAKSPEQKILVDIEGAVINPGVYQLSQGSRIVDALAAAGGMSEQADRQWIEKNINLAKKVSDGLKIYIPRTGEEILTEEVAGEASGSVMNVNTASATDLESLPGIGAVTAASIIESRPFGQIDELLSRKIVGEATFEKIKDKISAN
ncbi:MAG: ComEA family DNA-binding protein [Candidatus Levybacteria bacterium]|nr:ComEA family DNA-binding protein [Candidatus Levybacteria bacterium]